MLKILRKVTHKIRILAKGKNNIDEYTVLDHPQNKSSKKIKIVLHSKRLAKKAKKINKNVAESLKKV